MRALLIIIAGIVIFVGWFFIGVLVGRAGTSTARVLTHMKKVGVTGEQLRIYRDAIKLLNDMVSLDDIRDLTVDPEFQVNLPEKIRNRVKVLLERYRKEST